MLAAEPRHAVAQRDLGLDLLRVVAAAMVFVFHLSQTGHVRN
jgi:peptidoglycan/LPS O-acetylase OafA/YrhL